MDSTAKCHDLFRRVDAVELGICLTAGRAVANPVTRYVFLIASRLGNGIFWYVLMAVLAVSGPEGLRAAIIMVCTGLTGLVVYRTLKQRLSRERPFIACAAVRCSDRPLDRYSFPSGHTLHAFAFTTVALHFLPALAVILIPFTALVSVSRVVLGLHYPSDVAAGAVIGILLAHLVLSASTLV
ncbi:MAG: phosphatase PAP2 family protein [Gammaproteobacteria bacterium]|jgi:undecaprenyl-diphosphatase